jgi:N6-L-threonylcarbamoyladenine synthase
MSRSHGLLLAVESSCDETAVAVVERGRRIVADVVASQVALHSATGGIVPEVAARAHLRWMIPVLEEARQRAGLADWSEVDAVAVTEGPGLAGSLLVGITMAKTRATSTPPGSSIPARRSAPSLASRWSRSWSAVATPSSSR